MKNDTRFDNYATFIMKRARVIPLINGEDQNVTLNKLSKVNAVIHTLDFVGDP
jgi:hypothetical protein